MFSVCPCLGPLLLLLLGIILIVSIEDIYRENLRKNKVVATADKRLCSSGWCGRHEIRHPLMLNNTIPTPTNCGDHRYTLSCENHNQLFLYLNSVKFRVLSINYNNYTIRLVDANVALHSSTHNHSSLLPYSLTSSNFTTVGYEPYLYRIRQVIFGESIRLTKQMLYLMRCPPYGVVESSSGNAATCMMNGSYALGSRFYVSDVDKTLQDLALEDSCRIEWMYLTSWPDSDEINNSSISCTDLHDMLIFGFELSWLKGYYCKNDDREYAVLSDHNQVTCYFRVGLTFFPLIPPNTLLTMIILSLIDGTSK
ncbi:hypothetical protein PIB30_079798 [Stylosanthes scabra]|uniref:Wall-associated receptor kinase galacturonan-binding domain-containing protein n=1 Tax=Stylosanthes scabra TaxID=79078 RepID=A0ABU6UQ27_9FABA|nr:hypothetical protein [Stylosanthes scabra]